jgi:DNA (cytosine-5)-methyltransferase 1
MLPNNLSLDALNYDLRYSILDVALFNLPQIRERIYLLVFQRDYLKERVNFNFPNGKENDIYINQFVENNPKN